MKFWERKQEEEESRYPIVSMLMIRGVVGAYLMRLSWQLIAGVRESDGREKIFLAFFVVFFAIAGLGLIILALRDYKLGRYRGGAADLADQEAERAMKEGPAEAVPLAETASEFIEGPGAPGEVQDSSVTEE